MPLGAISGDYERWVNRVLSWVRRKGTKVWGLERNSIRPDHDVHLPFVNTSTPCQALFRRWRLARPDGDTTHGSAAEKSWLVGDARMDPSAAAMGGRTGGHKGEGAGEAPPAQGGGQQRGVQLPGCDETVVTACAPIKRPVRVSSGVKVILPGLGTDGEDL